MLSQKEELKTRMDEFTNFVDTDTKASIRELIEKINSQRITCGSYLQSVIMESNQAEGKNSKVQEYMNTQRNYVYSKPKELWRIGNLVYSILWKIDIGSICLYRKAKSSNYNKTLDGQQRLTSLYLFITNKVQLDMSKIPSLYSGICIDEQIYLTEELQGKYFKELPETLQSTILDYKIAIKEYYNCTEELANLIYVMKNTGMKALTAQDIRKAAISNQVRNFITETSQTSWMNHIYGGTDNSRQEIINYFITILSKGIEISLDKNTVDEVICGMEYIPDDMQNKIHNINQYLDKVFEILIDEKKVQNDKGKKVKDYNKYQFKVVDKTNALSIIYAAYKAIDRITENDFSKWIMNFFINPSDKYKQGRNGKVGDKQNVILRITAIEEEMVKSFNKTFKVEVQEEQQETENKTDNKLFDMDALIERIEKEEQKEAIGI
ncbi:MAG: DUF262 domain-containing protein [Tissierellia bacterium]|nr:DUF262 domain-containing protein [Tissierellia bacterium]